MGGEDWKSPPLLPLDESPTLDHHVDRWKETQFTRAQLGQISADRYYNVVDQIDRFANFVGRELPVTAINEQVYERYFFDLAAWDISRVTADSHLRVVRQFITWLYGHRLIDLPRNLRSSELRFKIGAKKIQVFTLDQIKALFTNSKGQPKLHILLGLSCGMGASDISAIKQAEVDWERGVITRKRVKTSEEENVPTVRYKLWEPTISLLRQFKTTRDPVLTTWEGGEWAFRRLRADGSLHKVVAHLDQLVMGQELAKRRIALGVSNHFTWVVDTVEPDDPIVTNPDLHNVRIETSNILLIGPSGSGKTHLVRSLASYLNVPLVIGDATSLTEAGYVGDDVESLLYRLNPGSRWRHGGSPELIGRLPLFTPLDALGVEDLARILTQPKDSLIAQHRKRVRFHGADLMLTDAAVREILSACITSTLVWKFGSSLHSSGILRSKR